APSSSRSSSRGRGWGASSWTRSSSAITRWSWRPASSSPGWSCWETWSRTCSTRPSTRAFATTEGAGMAEPHRHVLGDPESMPPEPVPVRAEEEGALALEAPRAAGTAVRILSAVLPGAGHFVTGAWARGAVLAFAWAAILAVAVLARRRIAAVATDGSLDD